MMENPMLLAGCVYELRAPKTRQATVSGYFDNPELLYKAASELDGKVPGIYVTLNPVTPALLARGKNRIQSHAKATTSDVDILRRHWLLLDCDPVRPAEISSSDAEHQAALEQLQIVTAWLSAQGWPDPLAADSGNGGHLLYRIDLPNDADSTKLIKAILEVLALKFDDTTVKIDTGVFNAARIVKLYGTMSCKGDHLDDRPHRRARLLSVPAEIVPASMDLLQQLGSLRPADPKPGYAYAGGHAGRLDAMGFIAKHGLKVTREKPWVNGSTVFELEWCPFNSDHAGSSRIIQFPLPHAAGVVLPPPVYRERTGTPHF